MQVIRERTKQLEEQLKRAPRFHREAAVIVRSGDLKRFRKFLRRHNIVIMEKDAAAFRDYLIINRVDLKDLEPEARRRLRDMTLNSQNSGDVTKDFREAILSGAKLFCRDCKWFVTAPNDGDGDDHDKSCVELGTKGADRACVGFLWDHTRIKQV